MDDPLHDFLWQKVCNAAVYMHIYVVYCIVQWTSNKLTWILQAKAPNRPRFPILFCKSVLCVSFSSRDAPYMVMISFSQFIQTFHFLLRSLLKIWWLLLILISYKNRSFYNFIYKKFTIIWVVKEGDLLYFENSTGFMKKKIPK